MPSCLTMWRETALNPALALTLGQGSLSKSVTLLLNDVNLMPSVKVLVRLTSIFKIAKYNLERF